MPNSYVAVVGLKSIIRELRKLGIDAQDLKSATNAASALVLPPAIAATPVKSGKLQQTVKASKSPNKVVISAGTNVSVPYANPIHFGWRKHRIVGNPWLLQVRDTYADAVANTYIAELQKLIQKAERRNTTNAD